MTDLTAVPWRTGRSLGRTVYARTGGDDWKADTVIGMFDTPALAEAACAAHNARLPQSGSVPPTALPRCTRIGGCLAEIGARSRPRPDPALFRCGCGRDPSMIPAGVAQIPWGETEPDGKP